MKKVLLATLLSFMFIVGCNDDDPKVEAPAFIKPHLHHLYKTLPDCFKSKGISNHDYKCDVTVKTTQATGEYKGHPTYQYNGKTVGGVTFGKCRSSSTIVMPVFGERYSQEVLQHELCHAYDFCGPCNGGHPTSYSPCCPSWPYLSSLEALTSPSIQCIDREIGDVLISITTFGDDVSILSVDDKWVIDLIQELDPDFKF